jgi:hypothetical protein
MKFIPATTVALFLLSSTAAISQTANAPSMGSPLVLPPTFRNNQPTINNGTSPVIARPSNPQDLVGRSNPQDLTAPGRANPQDFLR